MKFRANLVTLNRSKAVTWIKRTASIAAPWTKISFYTVNQPRYLVAATIRLSYFCQGECYHLPNRWRYLPESLGKETTSCLLTVLPVWPDWAIYWTMGKFLKPLATINLPKSPTILCNFCKGVKIYHFSNELIFGELLETFGDFFWPHWVLHTRKIL